MDNWELSVAKSRDPRLDMLAVRARYNDPLWFSEPDKWHLYGDTEIRRELANYWESLPTSGRVILNAGAGGHDLGLDTAITINVDISEARLYALPNPLLASVEALPLADNTIDIIVCVGCVINYCDAATVISEFGRVLRPGGYLLLECESSYSAELLTQSAFRQSAAVVETFYANHQEVLWAYSPEYIESLLNAAKFNVVRRVPIHVLSPWALLLLRSVGIAAFIARLDRVARKIPYLTRWASTHLFFCEKRI
jgi:SAM-dependent methyltransferase